MRLGSHSGYYLARNRSQHFHWQADYQFTRRFSDLFWPFPRLVIQFVTLPLVAEKSYLLAPALVMSLGLCLEIYSQSSWNSYVRLSSEALPELNFWRSNVASLNGIPIWPVRHKSSKIVYSDTSRSASGSFTEFEGKMFNSMIAGQILRKLKVLHSESW